MNAFGPSSLDSHALVCRLRQLVGDERSVQVEFLLHLDEFDRRQAFLQAGFGSLWDYCLRALHLREGAAGRRIGAMRALRRFPALEGPLRDGRLCLSTVALLAQVLTVDNLEELVARAAFRTKAEVEHLVASLQPRTLPRQGIRKLPDPPVRREPVLPLAAASPSETRTLPPEATPIETPVGEPSELRLRQDAKGAALEQGGEEVMRRTARRAEIKAVSADQWSLRVTVDGAFKEELETLTMLLSHKVPRGDLAAVLREAVRCAIEKHGKRKGSIPPTRERPASARTPSSSEPSRAIPAHVRRQVWRRDGGRCAFVGEGERRCGSRWQLELDHIHPASRGGDSTPENLRLACRKHNILYAEEFFGGEHMARFRRESTKPGFTIPGDSARGGIMTPQTISEPHPTRSDQRRSERGAGCAFQGREIKLSGVNKHSAVGCGRKT